MFTIAVDIGGTFTDLVGFDASSGKLFFGKSLTTYGDLVDGILNCIDSEKIDHMNRGQLPGLTPWFQSRLMHLIFAPTRLELLPQKIAKHVHLYLNENAQSPPVNFSDDRFFR